MTGPKAIKLLNEIWDRLQDEESADDYLEAIDFAVTAIRSQDDDGTSGQDRDSYSDDQDRDSYEVST